MTAALVAACVVLLATPAAASLSTFNISQAVQLDEPVPSVRVYLETADDSRRGSPEIGPGQLTASLGENALQLRESYPFRAGGEGVAYVFLIDISRSLSATEFDLILEALDVWILSLRPIDRVAIIAFGDESRVAVDFTADRATIKSVLYSLGPSDNQTVLHEALKDGLELCSRRDPDLPGRRVMMVLTDGRDEGSGLTADDVLELLRRDPVPIYAIGFSRIRDVVQRTRFLDLLRRFAANSGGAFYEGSTGSLGTAYEAIRRDIHGVWVADFVCPTCRADGNEYRLQVEVADEGRVLSSGRSLRLLPTRRGKSAGAQGTMSTGGAAATQADASEVETDSRSPEDSTSSSEDMGENGLGWLWFLLLLATGVGAWMLVRHRQRQAQSTPPPALPPLAVSKSSATGSSPPKKPSKESMGVESSDEAGARADASEDPGSGAIPLPQTYTLDSGVETTRPPRPALMRLVRLIVVRGSRPGRQYTLTLFKSASVGSRSTCDCVLNEPGVAPEQFDILQRDGRVYVRNLAGAKPTMVDGIPLSEEGLLNTGSLVGNREFIVRISYDEARPVNT